MRPNLRRLGMLVIAAMLVARPSAAAITHIFSNAAQHPSGSTTISLPARAAGSANNLWYVTFCAASVDIDANLVLSNTPNAITWTVANPRTTQATNTVCKSWWGLAPNTTAQTISACNASCANAFQNISLEEFSGTDLVSPLDNHTETNNTGTAACSSTVLSLTPVANDTALVSLCEDSSDGRVATWLAGSDDTQGDWTAYKILTGGAGVSQGFGVSSSTGGAMIGLMVSFKPSGSATAPPARTLLGVGTVPHH